MPVFRSGYDQAPAWCEMEFFFIYELVEKATISFFTRGKKEKLFICEGKCRIISGDGQKQAKGGEIINVREGTGRLVKLKASRSAIVIRIGGHWGNELGNSGFFKIENSINPRNIGDPVEYKHKTEFDNHYHDCDEYWIIYRGKAKAVSENILYTIGPGDCLVTGRGEHHDMPEIIESLYGIYFETTLRGRKRRGHLWNHRHGIARPTGRRI